MGMSGDKPAGKPSDAIGYVAEGASMMGKQYDPEKFPLTDELKAKGVTEEQWVEICTSLRAGKGTTGFGGGFSAAIESANATYFDAVGVVGVYAEYGPGQKAMVVLTQEVAEGGRVKTTCPTLKPKNIMGMSGDSMAGKPDGALGYVGEGASMFGAQYDPEKFPLTPEVKAKGVTDAQWANICKSLREGKGMTGLGGGFSVAIGKANSTVFDKVGLVGVYAEYGKGQKAMVVLDKYSASYTK